MNSAIITREVVILPKPVDLSPDGDQSESRQIRKRRRHAKSRLGCTACRSRRVKVGALATYISDDGSGVLTCQQCGQERPRCNNCQRREEACSLGLLAPVSRSRTLQPHQPAIDPCLGNGLSAHINMLQMKLLHHFDNVTARTLIFDESIWRGHVIPLTFQVSLSPAYSLNLL